MTTAIEQPTASGSIDAKVKEAPTSVVPSSVRTAQESVVKKPSEVVLEIDGVQRETGRLTDLPNPDEILAKRKYLSTVCCCIDPYVNEEASVYAPGNYIREGDVYKHRVHMKRMIVCFNLCYSSEYITKTLIQRASDGTPLSNLTTDDLGNINKYFLVKSEKCKHRHHDIKRYSNVGRILKFLCTLDGIASTLRKMVCLEDCVNTVDIQTLRCERSLYSRRHF